MNIETDRLIISNLDLTDAPFIRDLLNTPGWLRFIGDRFVRNLQDAEKYLTNGPLKSYRENGFGLWKISLKGENVPIGMCGLLKRDILEHPDIGFAFLPAFIGKGYAKESVNAVLSAVYERYGIRVLKAITNPDNTVSQQLLKSAGFAYEGKVTTKEGEELNLYSKHIAHE